MKPSDIKRQIKLYDRHIEREPDDADNYYLKGKSLINLAKCLSDASYMEEAMRCYDYAVDLEKEDSADKALYLIERSKLRMEMGGDPELAAQDAQVAASIKDKASGIEGTYFNSTLNDILGVESIRSNINTMIIDGKIDKSHAIQMLEHLKITESNTMKLDYHERDINKIFKIVYNMRTDLEALSQSHENLKVYHKDLETDIYETKGSIIEIIQGNRDQSRKDGIFKTNIDHEVKMVKRSLDLGGVNENVAIQELINEIKKTPELYEYFKIFNKQLKDYLDAYRIAGTGVVGRDNTEKTFTEKKSSKSDKVLLTVGKAGKEIVAGALDIFGVIAAVSTVYSDVKDITEEEKKDKQIRVINKVIESRFEDELSIKKLAYEATLLRMNKIRELSKINLDQNFRIEEIDLGNALGILPIIQDKYSQMEHLVAGHDVLLMIKYLYQNSESVLKEDALNSEDFGKLWVKEAFACSEDMEVSNIKKILQKVLDEIESNAGKGMEGWAYYDKGEINGVSKYINKNYLKKKLGSSYSDYSLKLALKLCFVSIMESSNIEGYCMKNFVRVNLETVQDIAQDNDEASYWYKYKDVALRAQGNSVEQINCLFSIDYSNKLLNYDGVVCYINKKWGPDISNRLLDICDSSSDKNTELIDSILSSGNSISVVGDMLVLYSYSLDPGV